MSVRSIDPLRLEPSFALLSIAETDLAAARTLHAAGLHAQAVFSLQQAVEKTVKAVGLATRAIDPKDLHRTISHKAIKVYVSALEKMLNLPQLQVEDQRSMLALTAAYAQIANDHVEEFDDVGRPSADELDKWLRSSESARVDAETFGMDNAGNWDPAIAEALSAASGKSIDGATIARFVYTTLGTGFDLYWLGLATLAHAVRSRYGTKTSSPSQLYSDGTPLVAQQQRVADALEHCQLVVRQCLGVAQRFGTLVTGAG